MYLLTQVWWYLLLAFLLGALVGYMLWRVCSRPMIEARYERSRNDLTARLALLEAERAGGPDIGKSDTGKKRTH